MKLRRKPKAFTIYIDENKIKVRKTGVRPTVVEGSEKKYVRHKEKELIRKMPTNEVE